MNKQKIHVNKREWLNPINISNSGAISYAVSSWSDDQYIDGEMSIWDCNRKVNLDFSFGTKQGAKNVASKINKMIDALEEIKAALGEAYARKVDVLEGKE